MRYVVTIAGSDRGGACMVDVALQWWFMQCLP
ncbi:Protein of unknown function [Pyronema omphalodes CBS 100304]|uniref:Uncharacterized protein n=1 Tax=Pyronema omphalodes (strain CBS 100304) TaxID=1076935 RepID=U4LS04_PYROM|nr:Protein of unknown function [Pyronema omphalodes CBS 100304]